jgi:hypothetical protein
VRYVRVLFRPVDQLAALIHRWWLQRQARKDLELAEELDRSGYPLLAELIREKTVDRYAPRFDR